MLLLNRLCSAFSRNKSSQLLHNCFTTSHISKVQSHVTQKLDQIAKSNPILYPTYTKNQQSLGSYCELHRRWTVKKERISLT